MAKNTSILLGDYFEKFVDNQVSSGRYSSVSEVIREALRVFEHEQNKLELITIELEKGEQSESLDNFDRDQFLSDIHSKYIKK